MSDLQRESIRLEYGFQGFNLLTTGQSTTLSENQDGYYAIKVLESSQVTAVSIQGDSLTAQEILPGDTVFGLFSSVTCVSGTILAYYR